MQRILGDVFDVLAISKVYAFFFLAKSLMMACKEPSRSLLQSSVPQGNHKAMNWVLKQLPFLELCFM